MVLSSLLVWAFAHLFGCSVGQLGVRLDGWLVC